MHYTYKLDSVTYIINREEWNKRYAQLAGGDYAIAERIKPYHLADYKVHIVWYNYGGGPVKIEYIREDRDGVEL